MSVDTTQYIITGVKVPQDFEGGSYEACEDFIDNGHDKAIKHKNGIAVIYDGRSGEYILIGRIKHKSQMDQPLDGPFSFANVLPDEAEMLTGLINLSFPNLKIEPVDISVWFVTHYH